MCIRDRPGHDRRLHPALTLSEGEVRFAVRFEAARTIEDVLARRNRSLFLDASAAAECIEPVERILAEELGLDGIRLADLKAQAARSARQCLLLDS